MANFKQNCLILSANRFEIRNDSGRIENSGVTVQYILSDNINPYQENENARGYKVAKASLPIEADYDLKSVPGVFECEFTLKPNAQGKPELKLISAKRAAKVA